MEWVHDWKGPHPSDTVSEYAGPEAPADIPEVPLKGGAFSYGLSSLRPSSRMATYAAYRSSRAEYVGFRCVRGAFHAVYGNASGQILSVPPVSLQASNLPTLLGATSAKLVFLNRVQGKGMLSWVDFGEASPMVRSLPDNDPVFHPVISPDGQWVAWSTVLEGSPQTGRIKTRRLAMSDTNVLDLGEGAIPRWWTSGSDTFLVRSSSAMDNTGNTWKDGATTAQAWSGGKLTGSVMNWSSGSYHDGRTGNLLYTGYRRLRQKDIVSGTERILFTYPSNGKSVGDTSQVCNVSASPDASGRAMFLDFGYPSSSTVVGRSYGIHEIAFVSDSTGTVKRTYPAPSGERQWEHLEWSNHSRWAVSAAIDGTGAQKNLYALDLSTGSTVKIASGEDLWQPGLWVGGARYVPSSDLKIDPDSAGAYLQMIDHSTPSILGDEIFREFSKKNGTYWGQRDSVEFAMVGSSRVGCGIICSEFHAGRTFNWGMTASHLYGDIQIIRNYILPHSGKLKVVGLSFMPGWFLEEDGIDIWRQESNSVGYLYDQHHGFWADSVVTGFDKLIADGYPMGAEQMAQNTGDWFIPSAGWGAFPPVLYLNDALEVAAPAKAMNMSLLRDLARDLKARGILLVLINFPQSPRYKETAYAETYGVMWANYRKLIDTIQALGSEFGNFHFYDAYRDGNHDYDSLDFLNESHLSERGARKLSHRLDSLIGSWMVR
jgi:hypothetical protein